ncbi:MAG: DMT family transporter [Silicimonas sp.]|nr:DMT family transporter [Silicimonas sp.]
MTDDSAPLTGALWALFATLCFTSVDVIIKFLSGDYALYQIGFIRSVVAMAVVFAVIVPLTGGLAALKTTQIRAHVVRGLFVVMANFLFFLGLAVLPLAEAVAIFFVSPLLIAVFSIFFLGERVGPRRWAAIVIGLIGVLIVLRPGSEAFQIAALFPVGAAACYAMLHILTRRIGAKDSAAAMTISVQLMMLLASVLAGLGFGHGGFDTFDHPSAAFLFRAWIWPTPFDFALMALLGTCIAFGGYAISSAYRRSPAAFIAPFEYVAMPIALIWGVMLFDETPDRWALIGIALIVISGLVLIWREAVAHRKPTKLAAKRL